MTSLVRPILSSILCCVIVFGHAPAWLHVATCDTCCDDSSGSLSSSGIVGSYACSCHSHHCDTSHHHDSKKTESAECGDASPCDTPQEGEPHDSDSCPICQSLASPCGFVDAYSTLLISAPACESFVLPMCLDEVSSLLLLPPSRGPPAMMS
ncbi:DUF2946 domain-containing protein [Rubripirellula amarantea]|uniref:DUF2946 domain-containing protein n=1 Tax=Rubripirellula amarantea TaxID=2527999 RepID=UPI0011B714D3|nr:DUF2946 domain-containing protein [Rubripirellula amarantea]